MIPKIIHYCWFGGKEKPELIKKCINSWKVHCPNYRFIEWNESNFDININDYVREAYESQKWAFVSDNARLYGLVNYGGIYLDTDVELLNSLDSFLYNPCFIGFEANDVLSSAVMGCEKDNSLFKELFSYYDDKHFLIDGKYDETPNTGIITKAFMSMGIKLNGKEQIICGCRVYPQSVLCPNNLVNIFKMYRDSTYAVHHFAGSWTGKDHYNRNTLQRVRMYSVRKMRNILGTDTLLKIKNIIGGN